jgi:hypothetical protein
MFIAAKFRAADGAFLVKQRHDTFPPFMIHINRVGFLDEFAFAAEWTQLHFDFTKCSNSTVWQYIRMTVSAVFLTAYRWQSSAFGQRFHTVSVCWWMP